MLYFKKFRIKIPNLQPYFIVLHVEGTQISQDNLYNQKLL